MSNKTTLNLIKKFEGCRLAAYRDAVNVWTIGYGCTHYPDGGKVKPGDVCTIDQAEEWLEVLCDDYAKKVASVVKVPVNSNQMAALVSFTYNVGVGALKDSTLLSLLNAGNYKGAAAQFDRWVRAGGVVLQGLVRRRAAERKLFETPDGGAAL